MGDKTGETNMGDKGVVRVGEVGRRTGERNMGGKGVERVGEVGKEWVGTGQGKV